MSVSCRAHGCIFLSFLLKRQKITTVGSERQKITTVGSERQKKSAMGRSVPKRWAQVDFTGARATARRRNAKGRNDQRVCIFVPELCCRGFSWRGFKNYVGLLATGSGVVVQKPK